MKLNVNFLCRGKVIHREGGGDSSQWLLLDYGDLIVHIQSKEMRTYYALDRLWGIAQLSLFRRLN